MARVLVIDDDAHIRANVRRFLALEGHEVEEAADGRGGLAAARAGRFDIVLCDVMMPGLDGFGVLAALRGAPETAALPVVLISASAEREAMRRGLELGAAGYIVKPFGFDELAAELAKHLRA